MAVKRESLLDRVQLADGRLAWPVAQSLGMSETTFRHRLKRMSPDDAVALPVLSRKGGPQRATRMRQVAEERVMTEAREGALRLLQLTASKPDIKAPRINMRSSSYWGTIAQAEGERIAVNASGSAYLHQFFDAVTGQWITARAVPVASILCRYLVQSPAGLMDAAQRLPDAPSAYVWSYRNGVNSGAELSGLSDAAQDAGGWDGRQTDIPVGELPHIPALLSWKKPRVDSPPTFDDVAQETTSNGELRPKQEKALGLSVSSSEAPSRGKASRLGWWLLTAVVFGGILLGLADCVAGGLADAEVFNMR